MSSLFSRAGGARLSRRRVQLFLLMALALASAVAVGAGAHSARATHSTSTIDNVSIDMDPSSAVANTPTSISTVESCAQINNNNFLDADEDSPDQVLVDVVIGPAGIPIDRPLIGFQFQLLYSPAVASVATYDVNQLIMANPGSVLFDVTDSAPSSTGAFLVAALDLGVPSSVYETGPGVLARLTLEGGGAGQSSLALNMIQFIDDQGEEIPYGTVQTAAVSVDAACLPPDADGDGIADAADACPNLAGPPDQDGCPPPGPPLAVGGIVGLLPVADRAAPQDSAGGNAPVASSALVAVAVAGVFLAGGGTLAVRRIRR